VCAAAPIHGLNRAQVRATVNVSVGGRPCSHAELLYVTAPAEEAARAPQHPHDLAGEGDLASLVTSDTLTWAAGELRPPLLKPPRNTNSKW
jgi:hypothetical protein